MSQFERLRLLNGLILVVMALFAASGLPPARRWRRSLCIAAIVGLAVAVAAALVESAIWFRGGGCD